MRLVIKGFGEKVAKCMGMCLPFINASIGSNGLEHIINILPFQWFFIFIRVSELQFITVESIQQQEITIRNKNKNRKVPLIRELQEMLNDYVIEKNIPSGPIFTDKNKKRARERRILLGNPLTAYQI